MVNFAAAQPRKEAIMTSMISGAGCACCGISRRRFLAAGCAACAGGITFAAAPAVARTASPAKPRIRIIYSLHAPKQDRPDWPNVGFEFAPHMQRIVAALRQNCPGLEFTESLATGPEDARKILDADATAGIDGYVVCQMNCWNRVVQTMAASGKPVLYADFQFGGSGGFLVYTAEFLRKATPNVGFVASSKMEDLVAAATCLSEAVRPGAASGFAAATARVRVGSTPRQGDLSCTSDSLTALPASDCLARMRQSKILSVRDDKSGPGQPMMEIPVENVAFAEVNEAWKTADKDQARSVAERWAKDASQVLEGVSRETLETSAAMYLAEKEVLKKHGANAITINCLGGFYGGHIHAYPCIGFHELNNEGLVGACECDVRSTATMVAFTTHDPGAAGLHLRSGDRYIEAADHLRTLRRGEQGFRTQRGDEPFHILTHSEDRQGASIRSILPVGYMTTTLEIDQPDSKEILLHRARAVANDPDDRACRTKLCAEPVGDIEKLFTAVGPCTDGTA